MKFIQTLHIDSDKNPFQDAFGWASPEYHLMGWALSCLQLRNIYENVTLYANSPAAHLLIDTLQLPYTELHLTHDRLTLVHPDLWALPKIYTYSLQEASFTHVDGDVFLFDPLPSRLPTGELIAQNVEIITGYCTSSKKELMQHFTFFPPCVKKDFESNTPIHAVNAGILGGNNLSFIHEYARSAFEYVHKNANNLQNINVNCFNIFFEQHLFYALAKEKNIPVEVLFSDIIKDNEHKNMGNFHEVPFKISYLHLLGHFKRDEYTCIRMADKLRELYPDCYYQILALCRKNKVALSPRYFNGTNFESLHKESIQTYREQRTDTNIYRPEIDEKQNTHLKLLKRIAAMHSEALDNEIYRQDFKHFYHQLIVLLNKGRSIFYLYGRDLESVHWYRNVFSDPVALPYRKLIKCQEAVVIPSAFDWGGLFNKFYRVGVKYYEQLQITSGEFFNLIIPEVSVAGFSLYDINYLDDVVMNQLTKPLSVNELLLKMRGYFEDEIIRDHYDSFYEVIISCVKHLVEKKAVKPVE